MELLVLLVIWGVFAWAGWQIGKPKRREELGLILGLFLGLIGIIIIACLPPKEQ